MHHLAVSAAAKGIKQAVQKPDKAVSFIIKIVMCILVIQMLISVICVKMIGSFLNTGKVNDDYVATDIAVYKDTVKAYQKYYDELEEYMDKREEEIIEEYTYTETETNEDGTTSTVTKCSAQVFKQINPISVIYYLSYINHIESEDLKRKDSYTVNIDNAYNFCKSISTYHEKEVDIDAGDIKKQFYLFNNVLTLNAVGTKYFGNDEQLLDMFKISYDLYKKFIADYSAGTEDDVGDVIYPDTGLQIPHYFQNDYKHIPYGTDTISSKGCAPTSIAMVLSYLKKSTITPADVVDFTGNKYYVSGSGSSWSIFGACASHWGVASQSIGCNLDSIISALEAGKPVIASMGPGTFTKGGHIIVIRGITADGYFLINDPNKGNYDKYGTDKFSCNVVMNEAKNFWCFG